MRSRSTAISALAGAALLLSGAVSACGSTNEPQATVTVTESAPAAATSPGERPPPPPTAPPTAGAPARPALDDCVRVDPAPDGRYQVFDAGTAVVIFADNRLTVESVAPAEGWTHRVDDHRPDEVEIEFRRGAEELDLEVEIDDGRLEVTICNDHD